MKIRLSDPDRERLGCPEWMEYDPTHLSVEDAEALDAAGGDWTIYTNPGPTAGRARVWVALHRAGITVTPYESLTFDIIGMRFDEIPGKAPSAKGGRTTRSTSATSSRRSSRTTSKR